jgi:hypothetical protein
VDGLGAGVLGYLEDLLDIQVTLRRGGGAEQKGLVGMPGVRGVALDLRVDGNGADPHLLEGSRDADGDLAAIGDQDFLEHGGGVLRFESEARLPRQESRALVVDGGQHGLAPALLLQLLLPLGRELLLLAGVVLDLPAQGNLHREQGDDGDRGAGNDRDGSVLAFVHDRQALSPIRTTPARHRTGPAATYRQVVCR